MEKFYFISFADFINSLHFNNYVIANSPEEALRIFLNDKCNWSLSLEGLTVEEIRAQVNDCDCSIYYVEI